MSFTRVRIKQNPLGRWYIERDPLSAWSGSRWVDHVDGIGVLVQVSNFETEAEARGEARTLGFVVEPVGGKPR
jgi:hypothetical protein